MKKSVILYGVRGNREYIEQLLDDQYEIIGYSDADPIYSKLQEYDYKPFCLPNNLIEKKADYIVITIMNQDISADVVSKLIDYGIMQEQIIETCRVIPLKSPFHIPLDKFIKLQKEKPFEGVFLGMSYTCYGILTYCFSKRFFKLSHYSADIFFHYKNIESIINTPECSFDNMKYIVFELPYYAFNWDVSRAKNVSRGRMAIFDGFNDYHNYGSNEMEGWYIQEYKILKDMFGNKLSLNDSVSSTNYENRVFSDFTESEHPFYKNEHIWTKVRNETIKENNMIFRKTLDLLYSINKNMKITIVVFPFYMEYLQEQMENINKMKDMFYQNINEIRNDYPIEVLDFLNCNLSKENYMDIHHLNAKGAYEFSCMLNKEFEKKIY